MKETDDQNAAAEAQQTPEEDGARRPARLVAQRPAEPRAAARPEARRGFLHLHKPGQGYWTRMGTAMGAGLIGILTAYFLYQYIPQWSGYLRDNANARIVVVVVFLLVYAFIFFRVFNRPSVTDFLIATDSEMKKVNWTSRKDLIGSTKVVILFMFVIAAFLFAVDVLFGNFFYLINVLKFRPF